MRDGYESGILHLKHRVYTEQRCTAIRNPLLGELMKIWDQCSGMKKYADSSLRYEKVNHMSQITPIPLSVGLIRDQYTLHTLHYTNQPYIRYGHVCPSTNDWIDLLYAVSDSSDLSDINKYLQLFTVQLFPQIQ